MTPQVRFQLLFASVHLFYGVLSLLAVRYHLKRAYRAQRKEPLCRSCSSG